MAATVSLTVCDKLLVFRIDTLMEEGYMVMGLEASYVVPKEKGERGRGEREEKEERGIL